MNKLDREFQLAVDVEMQNLARGDLEWITKLEPFSQHSFMCNNKSYNGDLIYFPPKVYKDSEYHSVVLKLTRKLRFSLYRSYLAGFSFTEGKVVPILSDLLYSCD